MAYVCELGTGRKLYLDNANGQTVVTISSTAPGQQQQASSSFQTGAWLSTPEVYLTADGAVVKLQAALGSHYIRVHGSRIGVSEALSLDALQQLQMRQVSGFAPSMEAIPPMASMPPMEPMKPMSPMPPMSMGDMQMNMNPMEMRMGNMEMHMGSPTSTQNTSTAQSASTERRFCSQCGGSVKPSDRFCTSCGHRLGE